MGLRLPARSAPCPATSLGPPSSRSPPYQWREPRSLPRRRHERLPRQTRPPDRTAARHRLAAAGLKLTFPDLTPPDAGEPALALAPHPRTAASVRYTCRPSAR